MCLPLIIIFKFGGGILDFNKQLDDFLCEYFPYLQLKNPLFYNSSIAIRFHMGGAIRIDEGREEEVRERALTLFNALNNSEDSIFLVIYVDSWDEHPISIFEEDVYKGFTDYVVGVSEQQISKKELEYRYQEPNDLYNTITYRYCTKVKVQSVNIVKLLTAITSREMGGDKTIIGDIFFVNDTNRRTVYYLYDDRGLDIVAENRETIRGIFEEYNDWILDYDRPMINKIFS